MTAFKRIKIAIYLTFFFFWLKLEGKVETTVSRFLFGMNPDVLVFKVYNFFFKWIEILNWNLSKLIADIPTQNAPYEPTHIKCKNHKGALFLLFFTCVKTLKTYIGTCWHQYARRCKTFRIFILSLWCLLTNYS